MEKVKIQEHYEKNHTLYLKLAENIKQALVTFLSDKQISYHTISSRIKELDSYLEKIERKGYDNPTEQIEDFCGLRIICFYPLDLEKIAEIIHDEFDVIQSIDKTENLEADRFGYRSNHYIVKIKKAWTKAPNYRGLENLKLEIQVRTILMHSWADIEHKLAYKTKDDIPLKFRRKLYQLSALLEIADTQFQELKNEKEIFKKSLIVKEKGQVTFDFSKDLNLDSLQAYLDFTFPKRSKGNRVASTLLEELKQHNISLLDLDKMRKDVEAILPDVEKEITKKGGWAQVGIARAILDLKSDNYWNSRSVEWEKHNWGKVILKYRKKIQTD
jgi:ppGpp synthetase/RelA/SpoT-type nucleotidyltranferase